MGVIDEIVAANEKYATGHEVQHLSPKPRRRLAIVSCMDTRLTQRTLGLQDGDAHIIRNAGGIVTDDVLRSLLVSIHVLGTEAVMIINHTDCGQLLYDDEKLRSKLEAQSGTSVTAPAHFLNFTDLQRNVWRQIHKVRTHPWVPKEVMVRGFIFDVESGRLREVLP